MATCRDCGGFVVFLKRPDGGYMRPVEPVSLDAEGEELFVADEAGVGRLPPQLYRKHTCLTLEDQLTRREALKAEKQRLIEADRERRRIAKETQEALDARAREIREIEQEARRAARDTELFDPEPDETSLKDLLKWRRKWLRDRFRTDARVGRFHQFKGGATRLAKVACRGCGADKGDPCWAPQQPTELQILGEVVAKRVGKHRGGAVSDPVWFGSGCCPERWEDSAPIPLHGPRATYFGEEDCSWPPAFGGYDSSMTTEEVREAIHIGAGTYEMREFLAQHVDIFNIGTGASPDRYRKPRRFLTQVEHEEMTGWLRANGSILWEREEVPDGPGGVDQGSADRSAEGVLRDGHVPGVCNDVGQDSSGSAEARTDESGGPRGRDGEHEDRT